MAWLRRILLFLLFPVAVFAQGVRVSSDPFVLKPLPAGGVTSVSGALITVCTSAGTGTPCTPKVANIYSDEALTTPIVGTGGAGTTNSDANGNFFFYLAPGSYVYTVTGSGITSSTSKITLSPTLASGGTFTTLNCKTFESTVCVDATNTQGWAGSEFAAWVNSAIAFLPLVVDQPTGNSYRSGTVWLAATGVITQTVAVTVSSPQLSIVGPGRGALRFNCTIAGDCWRVNTSPFTTSPGALLQGFTVFGSSAGSQNLIHAGDTIKPKLYDIALIGATGTSATCLWWDNVTNYTEQIDMQSVTLANCTAVMKYTNTNGATNSQSFGYGHYRNVVVLPNPGQIGVWSASVAGTNPIVLYHSVINWNIENNSSGGTNTFLRIDAGSSWQDNIYQIVMEENAANGGTMLNLGNNIALTGSGSIVTGSTFCGAKTDTLGTGLVINVQQITFCGPDQTPSWVSIGGGGGLNGQPRFYNPLPATVTVSQPAPPVGIFGNYWTGAATAVDKWFITHTLGTGANPNSILYFNHSSGSSGLAAVQVPGLIITATSGGGSGRQQLGAAADFPLWTWPDTTGNVSVVDAVYGTYRTTADFTLAANTSLQAITGLSWTMPANTALNVGFSCHLLYSQATAAVADQFGIQDVTVAPTSLMAKAQAYISAATFTAANVPALTTTTATPIVTFTPTAITTVWNADIDGMIEQPSNASTSVVQIMAQQSNSADLLTIKRGSFCRVW